MSTRPAVEPMILGIGLLDRVGVVGTALAEFDWRDDRADPLRSPGGFRRVFGRMDLTYRRIDRMSRALVLAAEAAGVSRVLDDAARANTAVVLETVRGCLESDVRFALELARGTVLGPTFPYTLPSTCLGEIALRHALRGPTLCLSTTADDAGVALREARAVIEAGEASHVLAASVEVLQEPRGDVPAAMSAVVVLVGPGSSDPGTTWPSESRDPFGELSLRMLGRSVTTR